MDQENDKAWWQPALVVFGEITGWIAAPILISLFVGRWLDQKYDSAPWFYLGLTGVAFIITMVGLVRVGTKYIKSIEKDTTKKSKKHERTNSRDHS